jgi:hypothetical protein
VTAVITGFVAARVADVKCGVIDRPEKKPKDSKGKPGKRDETKPGSEALSITLQPCVLATGAAVTDAKRRAGHPALYNPYICKVRLVE